MEETTANAFSGGFILGSIIILIVIILLVIFLYKKNKSKDNE